MFKASWAFQTRGPSRPNHWQKLPCRLAQRLPPALKNPAHISHAQVTVHHPTCLGNRGVTKLIVFSCDPRAPILSTVEVAAAHVDSAACLIQACQAGSIEADPQPETGVGRAPRPEAILLLFRVLGLVGQQLNGAARWMIPLTCLFTCMLAEVMEECRMQMALYQ